MPWIKLDDQIAHHPKFTQAGPVASWLFVCGLSYCARYLTDGRIPVSAVRTLGNVPKAHREANVLLSLGLWERDGKDYRVHDYHDYQPTKDEVEHRREERQASGRLGGLRSGAVRRSKREANGQATAKQQLRDFGKLPRS